MRRLLAALLLGLTLFVPRAGAEDPPAGSGLARIKSHRITARFDLAAHRLIATDVIEFDTSGGRAVRLLDPGTILTSSLPLESSEAGVSGTTLPEGVDRLELAYAKTIFDAIDKTEQHELIVPDRSKGLVSEHGIFLNGMSGWYARDAAGPPRLARFDVTTYVPEPFLVVTQGRAPERTRLLAPKGWASEAVVVPPTAKEGEETTAYAVSSVIAQMPTDDLSLVAGAYRISTRVIQGIDVSTYLFAADAADAPRWLDAMEAVITRYESRLGTYPYPKYDVVEGFLATDWALPSFALLGPELVRAASKTAAGNGVAVAIDQLDHDYVHGWFGNALFADPTAGDAFEALTSYLSGYLARELSSKDGGAGARRKALEREALGRDARTGPSSQHFPGRAWRRTASETSAEARAGARPLLFHAIRRRLGDAEFFARLKRFAEDRVGTYVGSSDLVTALDAEWARSLIDRPDLPTLRIVAASRWPGPKRSLNSDVRVEVVAEVAEGAAPWPAIDVPLAIAGEIVGNVRLADGVGVWTGNVNGVPEIAAIDPSYDLLRTLGPPELTHRAIAGSGRPALDVLDALRVLAHAPTAVRDPERFLVTRLETSLGAKAESIPGAPSGGASAVADLTSSRDLTITTATGTVVLKDAFRPICASPPRAKGKPLEFGEGDNPVPLPGRIPDTSVEGLERYWRQIELGVAPALMLLPNPAARRALASLVDAPNALTPEAEAELAAPGPDGAARPRPPLGPWIAERRAKTFPGLRPLRVPVLLITDEAYEKIFELKDILTVDFEVSFAPAKAEGAAGARTAAIVGSWLPPGLPAERPPVVVVTARVGGPGADEDASTGVACVFGALDEWRKEAVAAKRGLVVCVQAGGGDAAETAAIGAELAKRYDVRSVVGVDRVGHLRRDEISLEGHDLGADLPSHVAESLGTAGLRVAPERAGGSDPRRETPLSGAPGTPTVTLGAGAGSRSSDPIDPTGVARVSAALRELLRRLLTAP